MRLYLAARYGRRVELMGYADLLTDLGHEVVSTWIDGHNERNSAHGAMTDLVASDSERGAWAQEDCEDLYRADCMIAFTESPGMPGGDRGGRSVEFGVALTWGCRLIVVGPRENVFHCLPEVEQYATWQECYVALQAAGR